MILGVIGGIGRYWKLLEMLGVIGDIEGYW